MLAGVHRHSSSLQKYLKLSFLKWSLFTLTFPYVKETKRTVGGIAVCLFWNFQLILIFRQQFGMHPVQDILRMLCQCSQPAQDGQCSNKPKCEIPADAS